MQTKQLVGGLIAIGLPLAGVWMMMQPPGGSGPAAPAANTLAPAAKPTAAGATAPGANKTAAPAVAKPGEAQAGNTQTGKTKPSAILTAPVPVPKPHGKAEKSPVSAATNAVGEEYALFFTANGLAETDDCGCKARPLGGVARRAKWIADRVKEKRFKAWIAADGGGLMTKDPPDAIPPAAELKSLAAAMFKSFLKMRYVAMNVGIQDLAMGHAELKAAAAEHKFPLVSANIVDSAGKPVFEPHVVVPLGKIKVGFFGLLAAKPGRDELVSGKGLKILPPVEAAAAQVKALRAKGCQLIVALAQLTDDEKDAIGEQVSGVDLVLGSLKQDLTHTRPESMGRGFFADPYHKGKWLGEFIIRPGADQSRWYAVGLADKLRTDQVSLERQIAYYVKEFRDEDARKAKGEPAKMTDRERKFTEERFAGVRAKLARVKLELQDPLDVPKGGSTLQMNMVPMRADELAEDPAVLKIIDEHKKVYPPPPKPGR